MPDHTTENSLRGKLARKRAQLRDNRPFDIPVPGYESELVARYKRLDYDVLRRIGERQEKEPDKFMGEVFVAADTLANACVSLLEVDPDTGKAGKDTGYRWSTAAARDLFDVGEDELPDGAGARQAVRVVFADDTSVVSHFATYSELAMNAGRQLDDEVLGESAGSTEGR